MSNFDVNLQQLINDSKYYETTNDNDKSDKSNDKSNDKSDKTEDKIKLSFDYDIKSVDLIQVGDSFLDQKGLIGHHIESANHFYSDGIKQIITEGFSISKDIINKRVTTAEDQSIERISCEVKFVDVTLQPPRTLNYTTGKDVLLMPQTALMNDKTYSGYLFLSFEVKAVAYRKDGTTIERVDRVNNFKAAKVPIIKGSIMCNTYGKTKEALMQIHEDPTDPGGYFIVKSEWAVDCTESTTFNQPKMYINEGYGKSRIRCDFISKPGDTYQNSEMCIIIFNTDDTLTIEIARDKLMGVKIPYFLLFRAMGWSTDKELLEWIVFDFDDISNKDILNHLTNAIQAKYSKINYRQITKQNDALRAIVDLIPEELFKYLELKSKPQNYANAINEVLSTFDKHFMPHIGLTSDYRHDKLKFLALLIRKILLVQLRRIPQTDRDSYVIKRIHAAGDNYAKTFKTLFNQTIAMPIKKQMSKIFVTTPFNQVNLANLVTSSVFVDEFERLIVQTIVSGNKASLKIKRRTVTNRFAAQQLNRKNQLNTYATMRQISSTSADSAKQSERAQEMRRVHNSALGYICLVHSPTEGEKVGINKQMAIFASIAPSSSSEVLKRIISMDPLLIHESKPTPIEIAVNAYSRVYVNGHLIGYVTNSIELVNKYRQKRRNLEIHPYTTVYWDNTQDEVQFFVDAGRMTRPLIIVYNTHRDVDYIKNSGQKHAKDEKTKKDNKSKSDVPFQQGILINQDDITALYCGKKNIYDLVKEKKVEFITPEEQQNCYICFSFDELKKQRNNELQEYTHCDIPIAQFGVTGLTAPFANHNQPPRLTYQTAQSKQTGGFYAGNWPFRIDKETFIQYISEMPLVRTALNKYIYPNGNNCMVAIMTYLGYNQEDSIVMNKSAIDRGLFNGSKFTFYKSELEQKESLGNPDATKTENIKSANYGKLVNGIVEKGALIHEDDVLIGKYMNITKGNTRDMKQMFIDRSVVYKDTEEAIVQNVVIDKNEEGMRFAKVSLRKIRSVAVGDKFCLTSDHDVLTIRGWKPISHINYEDSIATLNGDTIEFHTPNIIMTFESKDSMFHINDDNISLLCNSKHKLYTKTDDDMPFELTPAEDVICRKFMSKVSGRFNISRKVFSFIPYKKIKIQMMDFIKSTSDMFLYFVGLYIMNGYIVSNVVHMTLDVLNIIQTVCNALEFNYIITKHNIQIHTSILVVNYLRLFGWDSLQIGHICPLNMVDARCIVAGFMTYDRKSDMEKKILRQREVDLIQELSIYGNLQSACEVYHNTLYNLYIMFPRDFELYSEITYMSKAETKMVRMDTKLYGINVTNNIMMVRRNNKFVWTGNSSRSGQKGIVAITLREEDMPVTESGVCPDIIFNPHGIPTRMTCAQLFESLIGNICALRGGHFDGTIFNPLDIESFANVLEQYGFNRYGYEKMISGITGEYIDSLIFFGPTYYQRLQKFVSDAEYSVKNALTDALTNQPLDGKSNDGGLRVGEMERDVLASHGSSIFLLEKFFYHSDGYTEYLCRCGKSAIVNIKEKIFKCNYCKDNADITAIPTSYSSKLAMQEIHSCNIGIRRIVEPFRYEILDSDETPFVIEKYDNKTVQNLLQTTNELLVDDTNAENE